MVVYELSDDTNNIKMHRLFAEIIVRINENSFFHKHFLNMDFSLNIPCKAFKFSTCIHAERHLVETLHYRQTKDLFKVTST